MYREYCEYCMYCMYCMAEKEAKLWREWNNFYPRSFFLAYTQLTFFARTIIIIPARLQTSFFLSDKDTCFFSPFFHFFSLSHFKFSLPLFFLLFFLHHHFPLLLLFLLLLFLLFDFLESMHAIFLKESCLV